jgi:hypothetical protein
VTEGKLRYDLVAVSSPLSLAQHVALFDQLGQDPVGRALRDPDRGGDVAQANSGVMSHAHEDVGVIRQKVPAGDRCFRTLLHVSRSYFHECMVHCVHNHRKEARNGRSRYHLTIPDTGPAFGVSAAVTDAGRVTHARRVAGPEVKTTGDDEMTISTEQAQLPFAGYDRLGDRQVIGVLSDHSQVELEAVEGYERSHEGREAVLNKLRYMRGREPFPGYDALSVEEIVAALGEADLATIKKVRGYERKFGNRARVLEEVVRVHRARRATEPASAAPAYQPTSARPGASRRGAQNEGGP